MHVPFGELYSYTSKDSGSIYVFGKLPTYPSPKSTLTLTSHLGKNVGLGKGLVGSFPETHRTPEVMTSTELYLVGVWL